MFALNHALVALVVSLCLVDGFFVGQRKRGRRTDNDESGAYPNDDDDDGKSGAYPNNDDDDGR